MAEDCRGYRIKDAETCAGKMLRGCCKCYDFIMQALNWMAIVIAASLSGILFFLGTMALAIVVLCDISEQDVTNHTTGETYKTYDIVEELIVRLRELQDTHSNTPISDFIEVTDSSTAEQACSDDNRLITGAIYMMAGGFVAMLSQVCILVSYFVVSRVSWRHMKDTNENRAEEKAKKESDRQNLHVGMVSNDLRQGSVRSGRFNADNSEGAGAYPARGGGNAMGATSPLGTSSPFGLSPPHTFNRAPSNLQSSSI